MRSGDGAAGFDDDDFHASQPVRAAFEICPCRLGSGQEREALLTPVDRFQVDSGQLTGQIHPLDGRQQY